LRYPSHCDQIALAASQRLAVSTSRGHGRSKQHNGFVGCIGHVFAVDSRRLVRLKQIEPLALGDLSTLILRDVNRQIRPTDIRQIGITRGAQYLHCVEIDQ